MGKLEHRREAVTGPLDVDQLREKAAAGWKLVALEWQREVEGEGEAPGLMMEEVPYGLRVAQDCTHLIENPAETQVLTDMLRLIIQDYPISRVAEELNRKGYRARDGSAWAAVSVFNMLPRLVQVGPRVFSSHEWQAWRKRLTIYA